MRRTLSIPAPQGGVCYREPLKRNFPVVESRFSVGLILEPWEVWIVTSSMLTPEVTYKCRLLCLSLLLALADSAHM